MKHNNYLKRLSAFVAMIVMVGLMAACSSKEGTSESTQKPDTAPNTLQGVGGEGGTCTVDPSLQATANLGWKGYEKKKFFNLSLESTALEPQIIQSGETLTYQYSFGDCHADTVVCTQVTPACKCALGYDGDGAQVIQVVFPNPTGATTVRSGGILMVVLDDGGGGGPN